MSLELTTSPSPRIRWPAKLGQFGMWQLPCVWGFLSKRECLTDARLAPKGPKVAGNPRFWPLVAIRTTPGRMFCRLRWCTTHDLTPLPARPADAAAFLAPQRYRLPAGTAEKPLATTTLKLRFAAIAYLHYLAGIPPPPPPRWSPRPMPVVAREAGHGPRPKLAAIGDDLPGLRDRALLLLGFAGALRRSELARIAVEHLEACEHGSGSPVGLQGRPGARSPAGAKPPASPPARCSAASGPGRGRRLAGPRPTWSVGNRSTRAPSRASPRRAAPPPDLIGCARRPTASSAAR